jgi:hypothetical protein
MRQERLRVVSQHAGGNDWLLEDFQQCEDASSAKNGANARRVHGGNAHKKSPTQSVTPVF